jgi:hypothetical protein
MNRAPLQERAELLATLQLTQQHNKHLEERVVYLEECLGSCHDGTVNSSSSEQVEPVLALK